MIEKMRIISHIYPFRSHFHPFLYQNDVNGNINNLKFFIKK